MDDIVFETLRALVLILLFLLLWHKGKKEVLHTLKGWREILIGVSLVLFASILDITDNFPALNTFEVIGHTQTEAFLEKIVGYLGGYIFLVIGFWQWIPLAGKLDKEQRFRSMVQNSSDWIWEVDAQGRYTYASPRVFDLLGYKPEEVLGRTPFDFMPPEEAARVGAIFAEIASAQKIFSQLENINLHKAGHQVVLETSGVPIFDASRNFIGYQGIDQDVTERKQAAQTAARRTRELAMLLEISRELAATLNLEKVLDLVARRITEIAGLGTSAIYLLEGDDLRLAATHPQLPPDFPEALRYSYLRDHPTIQRAIESNQSIFLADAQNAEMSAAERQAVDARDLRSILYLPLSVGQELSGVLIVATVGKQVVLSSSELEICSNFASLAALAIANAKLYEQSRRDSAEVERHYAFTQSVLKNAPMGIHMYRLEPDGRLIFTGANLAADHMLGTDNSQFIGKSIEDAFPSLIQTEVPKRYREIAAEGGVWNTDQIEYEDESIKGAFEIKAFQTSPGQMAVFFEDVTRSKQQEQALRASEERFELAMRAANDGLWDWDMQTQVVYFSPRWKSMLGYRDDELRNAFSEWEKLVDDAGRSNTLALIEKCVNGEAEGFNTEFRMRHKSGHWVDILSRAILIRDEKGNAARMVGTHVDISERKKAEVSLRESEDALKEAQRLAKVGSWELEIASGQLKWSDEIYRIFEIDSAKFGASYEAFLNAIHPDDRDAVNGAYTNSLKTGQPYAIRHRLQMPDGRIKYVQERCETSFDESSKPLVSVGTVQDVTEQILAEMALQDSKNLLQAVIEHLPMRVFWKDKDLNYLGCNPVFARDAGKSSPSEMTGLSDYQMGWAKEADLYRADDLKVIGSGIAKINFEEPQTTPDGKQIWLRTSKVPLKNSQNKVFGVLGMYEDVTERKAIEEELIRYRNELEDLVRQRTTDLYAAHQRLEDTQFAMDEAGIGIHWVDAETGRFLFVNRFAAELLGYSIEEMLQLHVMDIDPATTCERFSAISQELKVKGKLKFESAEQNKGGSLVPVEVAVYYLQGKGGHADRLVAFVTDITQRKQAELRSRQLLAILDKSPDFISTSTMEGEIRYLNPAGFHMVGMPENVDLSQKHISDFHPDWAVRKVGEEGIPATMRQGTWQGEIALLHADGHEIPAWQTILVHQNEQGQPSYLSTIIRDISKQKADEQALVAAKSVAEAANVAKSAFLANMSHEIRTPMSAVIGMSDLLLNTMLTSEQEKMAGIIRDSANTQLAILNDILDFSKIEAGKLELSAESFSLNDLVDKTCTLLDSTASSRGVLLIRHISSDLPPALEGDALRVRQILMNLITNAIKFSSGLERNGQVDVFIQLAGEEDGKAWIKLLVQDNGIGMGAATLERIFHPFTQADSSTTRKYGGTGLGLVITLRLVEMMGGELHVESTPGRGSSFTVRLPFLLADVSSLVVASKEERLTSLVRSTSVRKILVAEDNETNQEVIRQQLDMLGYQSDIAGDGREAFELWLDGDYGLVITDLHMPNMDGYQLAEAIRAEERKSESTRIPILALTANVLKGEAERCKNIGMDDYLSKPIPLSMLKGTLGNWLQHAGQGAAVAAPTASSDALVFDPAMLPKMVGEDVEMHRRLLDKFLSSAKERIFALQAAADAGDAATVGEIAHSLKSAARSVGAMQMGDLCERIEKSGKVGDPEYKSLMPDLERAFEMARLAITTVNRG